jgi:four helix bundle protein
MDKVGARNSGSKKIASFRDLKVYMAAFELQQDIFAVTKTFPKEETFALTNQVRKSSRSIGANIAEAWQKRRYEAHFVSKLTDADAEQAETQHWPDTALACEYLTVKEYEQLFAKCMGIGRMLGSMIGNPGPFCRQYTKCATVAD